MKVIEETENLNKKASIIENFSDVFQGLGYLLEKYHISIEADVSPVQHCLGRVLVDMNLITPVDEPTD